jgi:hypothetical protein
MLARSKSRKDPSERFSSQKTSSIFWEASTSFAWLNVEHEKTPTDMPSSMRIKAFRFPNSAHATSTSHRLNICAPQSFPGEKQRNPFVQVEGETNGVSGGTIWSGSFSREIITENFPICALANQKYQPARMTEHCENKLYLP